MISEADFNPLHDKASEALKRLRLFHQIVAQHSARFFPTLVMNDGAVAYRDLSFRHRSVTFDFLARAWQLFNAVKQHDTALGFPGPRLVLACGFRMRGRRAGMDNTSGKFASILERFRDGQLNSEQAIHEAASIKQTFDVVPQLQANFAFTKAYVAETSGSAGGLSGPNFFVDLAIFEEPLPTWIVLEKQISWEHKGLKLKGDFGLLRDLPPTRHADGGPLGILDALQIAQKLAGNQDVLRTLREAKVVNSRAP